MPATGSRRTISRSFHFASQQTPAYNASSGSCFPNACTMSRECGGEATKRSGKSGQSEERNKAQRRPDDRFLTEKRKDRRARIAVQASRRATRPGDQQIVRPAAIARTQRMVNTHTHSVGECEGQCWSTDRGGNRLAIVSPRLSRPRLAALVSSQTPCTAYPRATAAYTTMVAARWTVVTRQPK